MIAVHAPRLGDTVSTDTQLLTSIFRGEVTHFHCREAFSSKLNEMRH